MTETELNGDKILKNLVHLSKNTHRLNRLTHILLKKGIIDENERQQIHNEKCNMNRSTEMYIILAERATDSVFAKLLNALRRTGNSNVADLLEKEEEDEVDAQEDEHVEAEIELIEVKKPETVTEISATELGVLTVFEYFKTDGSHIVLVGLKNHILKLDDFKFRNPGCLTEIKFTLVTLTCKDIVLGLRGCDQLRSLFLDGITLIESEFLDPELNDEGTIQRVHLPALKNFDWRLGQNFPVELTQSYFNSWIFFYKSEAEKSWVLSDIETLEMEVFKIHYLHTTQCIIEIDRAEGIFRYGLEDLVDAILRSERYPLVKLELWNCRVSMLSLRVNYTLKELTLRNVEFENRKTDEVNHFFNYLGIFCGQLTYLHICGLSHEEIIVDLNSLPRYLQRLKLINVGIIVRFPPACLLTGGCMSELILCSVWFVNKQNEIADPQDFMVSMLNDLKTLSIFPIHSSTIVIDFNSLQNNLTKLRLFRTQITASERCCFSFAEHLVELELKSVTIILRGRKLKSANLDWLEQFGNLRRLEISCEGGTNIALHLNCLSPRLTTLILHDVELLLYPQLEVRLLHTGIQFGKHLQEMEFVNCEFEVEKTAIMPVILPGVSDLCMVEFKNWMANSCPLLELRVDSGKWLCYNSTSSETTDEQK